MKKRKNKWKKAGVILLVLIGLFLLYVEIANRHSKNMTYRQKILKATYPALMWFNKVTGKKTKMADNAQKVTAPASFYDLSVTLNNGSQFSFDSLRGKKVLLVNTASACGYTGQYDDLQKLSVQYGDKLVVLGFPANEFKEQEKGSDEEIAEFCRVNYGVTFPLVKKTGVLKGPEQNAVYRWLTDKSLNGWNEQAPTWNFSKYLVDENGNLVHYFDPGVSPMSEEVINAIK